MNTKLPITEIGTNIKNAREAKGWSQSELGGALQVSVQAISQWENGKTLPSLDNIMNAAAMLSVHPGTILWGSTFEPTDFGAYWPRVPIVASHAVPKIDWVHSDDDEWKEQIKQSVIGYITPTSRRMTGTYALRVDDKSMEPEFRIGDYLLIDFPREIEPTPGDVVVAVIPPGRYHSEPWTVLRKMQIKMEGKKTVFRLVPLNDDFPVHELRGPKDGFIAGIVIEQRRFHHTIEDILGVSEVQLDDEERLIERLTKS